MVIRVQTRDNEPVDKALRRLRKLCNNEGLTRTTKAKAYFEKPSERRRREARERIKAIRLACRAKANDAQKLLNRRRKARKSARNQAANSQAEAETKATEARPSEAAASPAAAPAAAPAPAVAAAPAPAPAPEPAPTPEGGDAPA
ncbi:MAG: 30S ribosomal protein S21 [Planctomycetota bacterium]